MKPASTHLRSLFGAITLSLAFISNSLAQDDLTPPEVSRHSLSPFISKGSPNTSSTRISVYFSEPVEESTATDPSHYSFPGSTITAASLRPGARKVILDLSPAPAPNSPYSLTIQEIQDLAGNLLISTNFSGTTPTYEVNLALSGSAYQSSTPIDPQGNEFGTADLAADGDIDGFFANGSVTINQGPEDDGWWEVDLGSSQNIGKLQVWFRTLTADECQALFNSCGVRNDDFRLIILDENRSEIVRKQYRGRPPGTVTYNLPPGIKCRYVRFEAQSPRTTSDGFFSLAEVAVIAPYENASIQVTQSPLPQSVIENQSAKFGPIAASVTGASIDRLQIQWEIDNLPIEDANASSYTTPPVTLAANGSKYRAVFLLPGISQASDAVTLTVLPDSTAPTLQNVIASSSYIYVTVTFSERVRPDSAQNISNYSLDGGLAILEVISITDSSVRLTTSQMTPGKTYSLKVSNVRDLASGTGNLITPNSTKSFKAPNSDQDRFVTISNPGNPNDQDYSNGSGPQGSVNYIYQIGKYEVNNTEYAAFLNAKAKSDPNTLWNAGTKILREGEEGSYSYTVVEGYEKKPVYFVAAMDSIRYVNWINNGAQENSDTETGAYNLTGYSGVSSRNPNADYFLPNENEWYKAAYYDPTKNGTGGYWLYPNRTSDATALNYKDAPGDQFTLCFLSPSGGPPDVCDEDAFPFSYSYYGTFGQAGNVWEWNELRPGDTRPRRSGGSWANNSARIAASVRADNDIGNPGASVNQGFRIARIFRPRPEFVTIGNPGNPNDQDYSNGSGPQGAVNYEYQIGKYEVNNSDYAMFLNAKAKSDPNSLWNAGTKILREGEDGSYSYTVVEGYEKKPVYFVAAMDSIRYVNWLNNGGREDSDTETGSYTLTGYSGVSPRNPDARIVLPNENEWYKAAYYDPTKGGTGGYWLYPNRTSDPNLLNFQESPGNQFTLCFLSAAGGPPDVCDEDAFPFSASYYGTFSQAGNVWEWNELRPGDTRPRRSGGSWANNAARIAASVRADNDIGNPGASVNQGFRIAKVNPRPRITISIQGNFARLEWSGTGQLKASATLTGPYSTIDGITTSPALVPVNLGQTRFFRVEE